MFADSNRPNIFDTPREIGPRFSDKKISLAGRTPAAMQDRGPRQMADGTPARKRKRVLSSTESSVRGEYSREVTTDGSDGGRPPTEYSTTGETRGNHAGEYGDDHEEDGDDHEDEDSGSGDHSGDDDDVFDPGQVRSAAPQYRAFPTPSRRNKRGQKGDEAEDFAPIDLDEYYAMPPPRVRVTTFKFPGEISGRQCVELRNSVEQYMIMNGLRYNDIQLNQSRNYRWKTWHLVVTADALHTGAFERVVKDVIQQVRGRKDSSIEIKSRPYVPWQERDDSSDE